MKTGTPDVKEVPHFLRCSLLAALMIDNNHCALPGGGPVEPYTGLHRSKLGTVLECTCLQVSLLCCDVRFVASPILGSLGLF
jgi:hypothetical protein